MAGDDYDLRTRGFLEWFRSRPGATFHQDIDIVNLNDRDAGRGIVATKDIPADTVLFTIPRDAIINQLTSDLPKRIPGIFEESTTKLEGANNEADEDGAELSDPPDSWVTLILIMIYEYLQGDNSAWKPYFAVLPQVFDTPMFWSDSELDDLQASHLRAKIGKDEADNMFRAKVLPVVDENADIFYAGGAPRLSEDELMTLAHRMGSTIMAYAFDLENDDEEEDDENDDDWVEDKEGKIMMGMVPMADILNADAQFNAHVNHGEDALTVASLRGIKAGEEILNYYGPLPNSELLRRYGYVTAAHGRYDVVEISWDLIQTLTKRHLQLDDQAWGKVVNELDPDELEDAFALDFDMAEPDSTGQFGDTVEFKGFPTDLEEQLKTLLKAVRKVRPDLIPDKAKRDEYYNEILYHVLSTREKEYPTSLEEDFDLISQKKVSGRAYKAVQVRWGEKRILQGAQSWLAPKINARNLDLWRAEEVNGRSSKKQRTR